MGYTEEEGEVQSNRADINDYEDDVKRRMIPNILLAIPDSFVCFFITEIDSFFFSLVFLPDNPSLHYSSQSIRTTCSDDYQFCRTLADFEEKNLGAAYVNCCNDLPLPKMKS